MAKNVYCALSDQLLAEIDAFMADECIDKRSEAIRRLVVGALKDIKENTHYEA